MIVLPFGTALDRLRTTPIVAIALFVTAVLVTAGWLAASGAQPAGASARPGLIAAIDICPNPSARETPNRALQAMVCMTNHARSEMGLTRYRVRAGLKRSADRKAADIMRCDVFSHTACDRPFSYWISRTYSTGKRCWSAGENIAWGSGSLGSVHSIFKAWMNSPGHRAAILSPAYRDLGIGLVTGRFEGRAGVAIWVQHFGKIC
jgi:uncharacterized protein YkwD